MHLDLNKIIKILLLILIIYICFISLSYIINVFEFILSVCLPFIIAFTISFILQPIIKWLEKRGVSKKISCVLTLCIFLFIIALIIIFIIPILSKQFMVFMEKVPIYVDKLETLFVSFKEKFSFLKKIGFSFSNFLESYNNYQIELINKIIEIFKSIFSYFIPIITTPILIIYFTIYYDEIENKIIDTTKSKQILYRILKQTKEVVQNYFKTFLLIILILTALSSICFGLLGIEYFVLWGLVIGITDIIPYIGPYIGGIIVCIFVISTSPNLLFAVIIIIVCIQIIESYFLTPKIQGKILQINPILVLFSVTVFGKILGIFGMLIAVPITRILQIIFKEVFFVKND